MAAPPPARSTWILPDLLPAAVLDPLIGPGAPFELVDEKVLGQELQVFVNRPRTLREMFDRSVAAADDLEFLVSPTGTWTFGRAREAIDRIAAELVERHGIGPGDRVGFISANSAEYGLAMWAALSVGAIITSLNGWWTADEIRYGIDLTTPSIVLGDVRRLERVAQADRASVPVRSLDDLVATALARADAATPPAVQIDEDDPVVILFTSGTTGRPKGATLSHRNILHLAMISQLGARIAAAMARSAPTEAPANTKPNPTQPNPTQPNATHPRQPASILSSPMFHVSGMLGILMTGPLFGTRLVFAPPGAWDETRHLELTEQHRITGWSGVPTQWWRIVRHPGLGEYDLSSLRSIGGGGAPLAPELVHELTQRFPGVTLANGYGMSETVGNGTLIAGPMLVAMPDSVGGAQAGIEVEIRDPLGDTMAEGAVGEIHIRGASVFIGYWGDDDATAESLDADRWYRTGDFGRIEGGMLFLESRMRDLILRGGENIYPMEVENRLVAHPDIDDAAVIGVDHPVLGQEVKAFVVLRSGAELTTSDIQVWVGETLAPFKVPAHVEVRADLPYTDTGKVLKQDLERQELESRQRARALDSDTDRTTA